MIEGEVKVASRCHGLENWVNLGAQVPSVSDLEEREKISGLSHGVLSIRLDERGDIVPDGVKHELLISEAPGPRK
jgi:hypothetical protein